MIHPSLGLLASRCPCPLILYDNCKGEADSELPHHTLECGAHSGRAGFLLALLSPWCPLCVMPGRSGN